MKSGGNASTWPNCCYCNVPLQQLPFTAVAVAAAAIHQQKVGCGRISASFMRHVNKSIKKIERMALMKCKKFRWAIDYIKKKSYSWEIIMIDTESN